MALAPFNGKSRKNRELHAHVKKTANLLVF